MNAPVWPEARIEHLIALVRLKYSARQIGSVMGISKNAVIGKVHRLNRIGLFIAPGCQPGERRPPKKKPEPEPPKEITMPVKRELIPVLNVPLENLASNQCRFPAWDDGKSGHPNFPSCGYPKRDDTASYCTAHAYLCGAVSPSKARAR